jgi:hypothetical protein
MKENGFLILSCLWRLLHNKSKRRTKIDAENEALELAAKEQVSE